MMKFKKTHPLAVKPHKEVDDLGYDFHVVPDTDWNFQNKDTFILYPNQRRVFNTGIHIEFPNNYGMLLKDRSGNAAKKGLHVLAGVIDPSYRGEIKICILNTSPHAHTEIKA
jgi:dUTP pyrophosphatase